MEDPKKHIDHKEFFSKLEIPYSKSKNEIWDKLSEKIDTDFEGRSVELGTKRNVTIFYAVAAVIIILLGLTAFFRFYSVELYSPSGQHLAAILPDGSKVQLNAQTSLTYKPYWWKFSRELILEGEAYFDVEKGKTFKVISDYGATKVLGTTFNIFARKKTYKVHCFTGKVLVTSNKGNNEILEPDHSVNILSNEMTKVKKEERIEDAVAWIDNNFFFTSVPLIEVFEELERQFDVTIQVSDEISDKYTGNFKRGSSPEELLDLICKPFGLIYKKKSTDKFIIQKQ